MKNKSAITSQVGITLLFCIAFLSSCRKEAQNPGNSLNNMDEGAVAAAIFTGGAPGNNYVANQVLMKFKKGTTPQIRGMVHARVSGKIQEHIHTRTMKESGDQEGVFILNVPMAAFEAIQTLKRMPEVEYAEPNYIYQHSATSNDPYFTNGSLWGMYSGSNGCAAATAWGNGHTGSSDVYVAIIDEGVMNTHEDLAANCWVNPNDPVDGVDNDGNGYKDDKWGWDFNSNDNSTFDNANDDHATHVAGTIGAVGGNGKGVAGVNWSVKMISCKFLGANGGTTANAIKALDYVTDLKTRAGINIVATNNSWGGGGYSQGLKDAIDRAGAKEILFIAAAGNSGTNNDVSPSYPASYSSSNIIAVAAISSNGALASFSQYGATSVDIAAPGVGIYSSLPANSKKNPSSYGSYNGTSMATPHVTGAAALYASNNSGSTAASIKAAILGAAVANSALNGKCVTGGMLNVSGF